MLRFLIYVAIWGEVLNTGRRLLKSTAYSDASVDCAVLIWGKNLFETRRLLEEIWRAFVQDIR